MDYHYPVCCLTQKIKAAVFWSSIYFLDFYAIILKEETEELSWNSFQNNITHIVHLLSNLEQNILLDY